MNDWTFYLILLGIIIGLWLSNSNGTLYDEDRDNDDI